LDGPETFSIPSQGGGERRRGERAGSIVVSSSRRRESREEEMTLGKGERKEVVKVSK
jgi:hypothetical protein